MPKKTLFTVEELRGYFSGEIMSVHTELAREAELAMRVHSDGVYPKDMIEERRPNEPEEVKEYRAGIWKPKTKPYFSKIITSLSKIRRSSDWSIQYPDVEFPRIPEGETLEDYCEVKFPFHKSITNWAFSTLLREWAVDPNAVMLVMPLEPAEDETEFIRPFPTIYNSTYVIEHREENYSVIENPIGVTYYIDGHAKQGKSFFVVTTEQLLKYDQIDDKPTYELNQEESIDHNLGYLPAYKLGAVLISSVEDDFLYESRLAGILPEFDEANREYSDLQASKVMHIYAERWEIATQECPTCNGSGRSINDVSSNISEECPDCSGRGVRGASPYEKMIISSNGLNAATGQQLPIPPAGFVEKDVEIVRIQDEGVKSHIREGLSAINMEHLADIPLAQSGVAKEVDRDETNNFAHAVGEDIVRVMDWLYRCIATWRYGIQHESSEIIDMIPTIPVPEHFDIFSTKFIEEEIKSSKENKLNPIILNAMELNYASKKFNSDPDVRDRLMLILELDPLPNISEDDKQARLMNKGIRLLDYIISSNIQFYIQRALIEDENFAALEYAEQRKKLEEYAKEVTDENDEASKLKITLNGEQEIDPITGKPIIATEDSSGSGQAAGLQGNNGSGANAQRA